MKEKKAIVIGAGVAGICSAIRLANLGFQVNVFEHQAGPGGKLTSFTKDGFRFDKGPSLFTMPSFLEELFSSCGRDMSQYLRYKRKETICEYFYPDGTRFTAHADRKVFADKAATIFNDDADSILGYLKQAEKKYDATASVFLEKSLHRLNTYLSFSTLNALVRSAGLGLNRSLHAENERSFKDPRLVQLFDRYATYNGSDPYRTPGIMSMIPHLEQYHGTFFPEGGMYSITTALVQLAHELGVTFHYEQNVEQIHCAEEGVVKGIRTKAGHHEAEIVVSNMDVVPTYRRLLSNQKAPERTLSQERSSSALIFYWGIQGVHPELDLHNIFFSADYQQEFEYLFKQKGICDDPTVYVHISSKDNPTDAPSGHENWFVMVNAPGDQGQNWEEIKERTRSHIISKLSRQLNKDIGALIISETVWDPPGIQMDTSSHQGSLYGAASNDRMAAFLRHPNFSRDLKGLYFCGGSVHPGGGIPLCVLSSKIVGELVSHDYPSQNESP